MRKHSADRACGCSQPGRRQFLMRGATALTALAIAAFPRYAAAQQKASKEQAGYQPRPKDSQSCASCTNFMPPRDCKVVEGPVAPNGWSRLYKPK